MKTEKIMNPGVDPKKGLVLLRKAIREMQGANCREDFDKAYDKAKGALYVAYGMRRSLPGRCSSCSGSGRVER